MGSYYALRYRNKLGVYEDYEWHTKFLYMDYQRKLGGEVEKGQIVIPWGYNSCDPWYDSYWVGEPDTFDVRGPDMIVEVWRGSCYSDGTYSPMRLEGQFLTRNYRRELLNDGRLRTTIIVRGIKDFISRPIIYPPTDPPPPVGPAFTVTDEASMNAAITDWALRPTQLTEQYRGVPGADTKQQMEALMEHAKLYSPRPLLRINTPVPAAGGGITDHPVFYRFDNLLDALNEMSSASWYAWFHGVAPVTDGPVDWDLEYAPTHPFYPYEFKTYVGGRGVDRRIGNPDGNPPVIISAISPGAIQPVVVQDRTEEITRVLVGGSGNGTFRDMIAVESPGAGHSPWNVREKFVNSSKSDKTGVPPPDDIIKQMVFDGQGDLRENGFNDNITVIIKDTAGFRYGVDYDLGDLVTIQWPGRKYEGTLIPSNRSFRVDRQIVGVKVQVFNHQVNAPGSNSPAGQEQIELTLAALDGSRHRMDSRGNLQKILEQIRDRNDITETEARMADAYR